jgi:hypothetical protein
MKTIAWVWLIVLLALLVITGFYIHSDYFYFTTKGRGLIVTNRVAILVGVYIFWLIVPNLICFLLKNDSKCHVGPFKLVFKIISFNESDKANFIFFIILGLVFSLIGIIGGIAGLFNVSH